MMQNLWFSRRICLKFCVEIVRLSRGREVFLSLSQEGDKIFEKSATVVWDVAAVALTERNSSITPARRPRFGATWPFASRRSSGYFVKMELCLKISAKLLLLLSCLSLMSCTGKHISVIDRRSGVISNVLFILVSWVLWKLSLMEWFYLSLNLIVFVDLPLCVLSKAYPEVPRWSSPRLG